MTDEFTAVAELPTPAGPLGIQPRQGWAGRVSSRCARVRLGVRHPGNWLQLMRFGAVGASGYVVNLIVFAVCVHLVGVDYRVASAIAFLVSVNSNFWLNRHWTFGAKQDHPFLQAVRFYAVSLVAYGFSYVILVALVTGPGLSKVIAQAVAIVCATPLSFVGQKLWSFRA